MDFEPANGEETPLRRIKMRVPRGHHLSALTFVIRSEDGEHWWRDNGGNFTVPLPGSRQQKTRDRTHSFDDELRWATWGPAEPGVGTSVCGLDACA
jgi:hypothetical protein